MTLFFRLTDFLASKNLSSVSPRASHKVRNVCLEFRKSPIGRLVMSRDQHTLQQKMPKTSNNFLFLWTFLWQWQSQVSCQAIVALNEHDTHSKIFAQVRPILNSAAINTKGSCVFLTMSSFCCFSCSNILMEQSHEDL